MALKTFWFSAVLCKISYFHSVLGRVLIWKVIALPFEMTTCQSFRLPGQAGGLSPNLICHLQDLIVLASTEWAGTIFSCQSGGMRFQNSWKFCSEKKRPAEMGNAGSEFMFSLLGFLASPRPLSQWCMVIPVGFCSKSLRPWDKMSWLAIFSQRMLMLMLLTLTWVGKGCARGKAWMTGRMRVGGCLLQWLDETWMKWRSFWLHL